MLIACSRHSPNLLQALLSSKHSDAERHKDLQGPPPQILNAFGVLPVTFHQSCILKGRRVLDSEISFFFEGMNTNQGVCLNASGRVGEHAPQLRGG